MVKSKWKIQINEWEESLRYSDPEKIELKTLLKTIDFRDKRVLDIGCGIARLTLPLSRFSREIIAIDKEKEVIEYCKKNKKVKNIHYLVSDIINFKEKDFDVAIFAQPDYDNFKEKLKAISKALKENGKLVIIRWIDNKNQYNKLLSYFWKKNKILSKNVEIFSKEFISNIKRYFNIKKVKLIKTYDNYPSREKLSESIIRDSPIKFNIKDKEKLAKILLKYNYKKVKITMKMYVCEKK